VRNGDHGATSGEFLEPLFRENFQKLGELGVAISVWQDEKAIIAQLGESGASERAAASDSRSNWLVNSPESLGKGGR
jgi:hypothetical protein